MQLICIDEQSFSKIREKNGVYVDKTKIMYNCFKDGTYFFISRPRRFGKSLLCSTAAALFAGRKELFKGLWIEESDWAWDTHPVIHLDMTKAASAAYDATKVEAALMVVLRGIARDYEVSGLESSEAGSYFGELLKKLHKKTGKQVVVIVDEYDKPLLDVILKAENYKSIHEVLRNFYAQLKANSDHLRFVLLTGVFKFAQTSIFSGLNNLIDLTFLPGAAELLGYTEQEIKDNFPEHLENLAQGYKKTTPEMLVALKEKYNGYSFGVDDKAGCVIGSVYNPFAINYVFHQQQLIEQWFASGTPTLLIDKLKSQSFAGIDTSELRIKLGVLKNSYNPDEITSLSLLYYAGYVTIKNYLPQSGLLVLDFPNAEVAQSLSLYLLPQITEKRLSAFGLITEKINTLLYDQDLSDLKDLFNQALAQLPYHMFGTQESYYQTVFYLLLNASSVITFAEDMSNRGRADITVLLPKAVYIFELKMNQPAAVGIEQIKERGYAEKYRTPARQVYLIGIELSKAKRVIKDLIFEKLA